MFSVWTEYSWEKLAFFLLGFYQNFSVVCVVFFNQRFPNFKTLNGESAHCVHLRIKIETNEKIIHNFQLKQML